MTLEAACEQLAEKQEIIDNFKYFQKENLPQIFANWYKKIVEGGNRAFAIQRSEDFLRVIGCERLAAPSSDKTDITMQIHDIQTGYSPVCGFSIKSEIGNAPTLINATGATNFVYEVEGLDDEQIDSINAIDTKTKHNHLDLLFVKSGTQGKGIGKAIWFAIEKLYPDTKIWETCTPYFEKRNIHFYVNVCGFHITEFFNEKHPMPDTPDDFIGDGNERMFAFKKVMQKI